MGTFTIPLEVADLQGTQFIEVESLVDTGATYTSIPEDVLNVWELRSGEHVLLSWQTTE